MSLHLGLSNIRALFCDLSDPMGCCEAMRLMYSRQTTQMRNVHINDTTSLRVEIPSEIDNDQILKCYTERRTSNYCYKHGLSDNGPSEDQKNC